MSLRTQLYRFSLVAVCCLTFAMVAVIAAPAQNSSSAHNGVPATARQAAQMPQFASRLHLAARPLRGTPVPRAYRSPRDPMWPQDEVLYNNGPVNGTTDAWTINFGYWVSNTFQWNPADTVTGFDFYTWSFPGDRLQTVDWSITSDINGGTVYGKGTASVVESFLSTNQFGYDIHKETVTGLGVWLSSGPLWFNLQNATTDQGNPIYWDENSGVGCNSPGCPSQAVESELGTVPSEAFDVSGSTTTITCGSEPPDRPVKKPEVATAAPSPTQAFQVIYNFTGGADGAYPATGLAMDAQGNLYGTAGTQWLGGNGTVFKLSPGASGWRYTRLYAFSGADGDLPSSTPVLGPDGSVSGTTGGGGLYSSGVLFGLSPGGNPLPALFSNWTQKLMYSFNGGTGGTAPLGDIVVDASGNIFGTVNFGGANGFGTLYEYSNGGLQVLHAFGAGSDGRYPVGLVQGKGGLYGITTGGGGNYSGTVYTTAGGYQILFHFQWGNQGDLGNPLYLTADSAGNLFGTSIDFYTNGCEGYWGGTIFELLYPDWTLVTLASWWELANFSGWVTPDGAGNLYGTANIGYSDSEVFKLTCCWTYTTLHQFSGPDGNHPNGKVLIDAKGNIFGATSSGGAYGYGTVWEISP